MLFNMPKVKESDGIPAAKVFVRPIVGFLVAALVLSMFSLGSGGCVSGPQPIPPVLIDEEFVKLVEDALNIYIKDPDKAQAAQLILRLVVYVAKQINKAGDAAAAKALEDKAKAIPPDAPDRFERAKAVGEEAVAVTKAHVKQP